MSQETRDLAKPVADEIVNKILYHLRYKMNVYPKEDDVNHLNRITKSIIVQAITRFKNIPSYLENVTDLSMKEIQENCIHTHCWDYGKFRTCCCFCKEEPNL